MANEQLNDLLTSEDLKGIKKYVLSKDELKAPRELTPEEKDRVAFRRAAGWSVFNPIYDTNKRDVAQHIQNPTYRAAIDTLGGGLPAAIGGLIRGHVMRDFPGVGSGLLSPSLWIPVASALPSLLGVKNRYLKQKLYNDIAEEYIKHHPEGQIASMPNVIKEMTAKQKAVNDLTVTKKKIKEAADFDDPEVRRKAQQFRNVMYGIQAIPVAIHGYGEYLRNKRDKAEMNDLRERFERKLRDKAEAEMFITKVRMPLYRKGETEQDKIDKFHDMFKAGADNAPMLPHQQRIVDKLEKEDQPGLILMHGLGSGKTRSSIEAYKKLGLPAEVLLPAALKGNYEKEVEKWVGKKPKDVNIRSQQEIARKGIDPEEFKDKLMIIDEAHRLRNEDTKLYKALKGANAKKRVLLTGTPIYNHPSDIAKLINIAAGKTIMPERGPEFEKEYISNKVVFPTPIHRLFGSKPSQEISIKNKPYLKAVFHKLIDYHAGNSEGFPEVSKETVNVPMNEKQQQLYRAMMKDLPWHLRMKVSAGLPPEKKELDKLIPFLTGARQISNSTSGFEKDPSKVVSPKIEKAFSYLKSKIDEDPTYKGLIYSNYLDSGVNPYKKLLEEAKIPYGEFTGDIKDSVRNQLVKDYNANKLKALIVSSAGGEGLDLKGTRLVQLMEPHFNNEKIKQVIGRAARYKSHETLPEDKRKVLIQNYLSSLTPSTLDKLMKKKKTSTDEYLQNLADEKEKLNNEFIKLIKD